MELTELIKRAQDAKQIETPRPGASSCGLSSVPPRTTGSAAVEEHLGIAHESMNQCFGESQSVRMRAHGRVV